MANKVEEDELVVVDASIYIFRYYFSMPANWHAHTGRPTESVYGYLSWLLRMLGELQPQRIVACFDESLGNCFRNQIYPGYKTSRALPDDDLAFQLLACKRVSSLLGISCVASDRYEADDLIGTYAHYCSKKSKGCTILSRDKDLGQLVLNERTKLWDFPSAAPLNALGIEAKFGVSPEKIPTYLALVGDAVDDIPGVPGIGKKTAAQLLTVFENWEDMKQHMSKIHTLPLRGASRIQQNLIAYSEQMDMCMQLTTIAQDACEVNWQAVKRRKIDTESLCQLNVDLGFPESLNNKIRKLELE